METNQDTSLFLMKILEELDSKQNTVSYQDLCKSLCARFDLSQLAKLRSVLFYTACLDPNFPATLFKDKMKCTVNNQQSKKIMVAADIVTIFNLIQMNGGAAKEKLPSGRQKVRKKETSFESCRSDTEVCAAAECEPLNCELSETFHRGYPARRSSQGRKVDRKDCPQFLPASEPNFLLGVSKELKSRAASLDRLQALAPYSVASPQPCEMQRTYFPMNIENESISDQDSLPIGQGIKETFIANEEPFVVQSCVQKRNIFKEDFHNLMTVSPTLVGPANKAEAERGEPQRQKESHKTPFFNHSFEMPYNSQYLNPVYSPVPDKRRAKHESLDDLQASTYFGPTPVMGPQEARRCPGRPGKQTPWPVKSWSLNTEEVPDFERSFFNRNPSEEKLRYPNSSSQSPNFPTPDRRPTYLAPKDPQQPILPVGYVAKPNGLKSKEMSSPVDLEKHEPVKKFKEKSVSCTSGQLSSDTSSVGTQTEQHVLEPQKGKDLCTSGQSKYADRHTRKLSDDDSEIISDDISDIFRFLDDMSISGSTGVMQSSCYNSTGSLSQVHKSDGDSSPERHLTKIANGLSSSKGEKGNRPENSHPSEEELKTSVCRLVLRIGEIERKLESLSGVREEISQVLGKLNKLDQKMQQPEKVSVQIDLNSLTSEAPSDDSASPRLFRAHSGPRGPKLENAADWYCSDASGSNSESLRVKALKKSLFPRPSSRSLTEENSATESKIASTSNSPRDWRTITYASRAGLGEEDGKDRGPGESKDWHRKSKEADRQYDIPPSTDCPSSPKTASWWSRCSTQESLNPNNLEYWMEDIYTPGYDSLLKRKEAEFRRAKVCKIAALIAAATCTVILVIVVPICTMKS
ncbi:unnamed protein product [Nyctereutes procyonoides]|uniref:(raccoon dog) hypothetical protein n=1 Tax=Nyctereutes procyonoides TaxID=34880 RepID=A0A811YNP9_NYCPR|nr:unnamed protein product [Nyctereutes procyonoides]